MNNDKIDTSDPEWFNQEHEKFLDKAQHYFKGVLDDTNQDCDEADTPDGAWFFMLEQKAEYLLSLYHETFGVEPPKNLDGNDIVQHWLRNQE